MKRMNLLNSTADTISAIFSKNATTVAAGGVTAVVMPLVRQLTAYAQLAAQLVGLAVVVVVLMIRWKEYRKP